MVTIRTARFSAPHTVFRTIPTAIVPCTAFTGWSFEQKQTVFSVTYELTLYIKYRNIFVFKGLRSFFSYLYFPQNNKIHHMYIRNDVQKLSKDWTYHSVP